MGIRGKWREQFVRKCSAAAVGCGSVRIILLNYPANYSAPIFRFADFNAGWYASRNAAFQNAVGKASGVKLVMDGDSILYGSSEPGKTELAVRKLAGKLGMSESEIHRQLQKGDSLAFEDPRCTRRSISWRKRRLGKRYPVKCCQAFSWKARRLHVI